MIDIDWDAAATDVLEAAARVLLVLLLAFLAAWFIQRMLRPVLRVAIREQMNGEPEVEIQKRIDTVTDVLYRTTVVGIAVVATITVLPEFGVNAGPLIASLGLVGLAVGFGAQYLVRDVINGVEILMENQYTRGDFVGFRSATGGTYNGFVEDVNLRRTVLRDNDGAVHFISHGQIDVASNYTRGFSRIVIGVPVAYTVDLDRVFAAIDKLGAELAADPEFGPSIREAPRARGVDRFGETSLEVHVECVTEPGEQWRVAGELRRRLKGAFDAEGINVRNSAPGRP